ncbi:hypothetical protein SLEP1_g16116 [Rubroshorea leprosula]|uniref:Uncharacterized protein n=1 Tax=Rubroshorea leprosula TaxID=152421 RepID=A0AAV5IPT2_9ROSI|nr:hypothetical protein SLEP1_g16116 [Rubroshorea leprosula]
MSNWIECYNPWTNIWHHFTRIPGLKDNNVQKGFSTVSIGDSLYIIGGKLCHKVFCHDEIGEVDLEVVLSSVLRENPRGNKGFAETADLDEVPCSTMARCSAEVYDSENAKWDLMQGMWQLDVPPNQIVAVGCKLYISGDCLNAWKGYRLPGEISRMMSFVHVFDTKEKSSFDAMVALLCYHTLDK